MSGGHFNYAYSHIGGFAFDLEQEIYANDDDRRYDPIVVARLKRIQAILELAADLGHAVEWLYSDDYGEEYFMKRTSEILDEARTTGALS